MPNYIGIIFVNTKGKLKQVYKQTKYSVYIAEVGENLGNWGQVMAINNFEANIVSNKFTVIKEKLIGLLYA